DVIVLNAVESAGAGNDLTVLATASVTAGRILILEAGDNITVASGATTTAGFVAVHAGFQNAEPNTGVQVTFLGELSTPGARLSLAGTDANDVFLLAPQVAPNAVPGTTVEVLAYRGMDVITVRQADVPTTIDTGAGADGVVIAADGGQLNVTRPVINAPVT